MGSYFHTKLNISHLQEGWGGEMTYFSVEDRSLGRSGGTGGGTCGGGTGEEASLMTSVPLSE